MSKTILSGPAGSGKTHRVLDEFIASLKEAKDPLALDSFLVLPSAEHCGRVITLLMQRGMKGYFHRRITTFSRLVREIFGAPEENFVSNTARMMIVGQILQQGGMDYFSAVRDTPGFVHLASQFILELKESLISAAEFRERSGVLKKFEPELAPKYEALAQIYEAYEKRLAEEGLKDRQDLLALCRAKKQKIALPHFRKIWMDGFFDFSDLQLEYLKEILGAADEVTLTLTLDPAPERRALFEPVHKTLESLTAMGFKEEKLKPVFHRSRKPELAFLERHLFSENKQSPQPSSKQGKKGGVPEFPISILKAVGQQGEIEMIAREIERLSRSGEYRYSDFAVLFRQVGNYEPVIRSVFRRYRIPVEFHERERLKLSPSAQTLVTLLRIFRDGWKRPDVAGFLKSSYVRRAGKIKKNYEWVCELEHRALLEGLSAGRDAWLEDWKGGDQDEKAVTEFNRQKKEVLSVLAALEDRFLKMPSVAALEKTVHEAVRTFGLFEIPSVGQMQPEYLESLQRDALSRRRIDSLLDEIRLHYASRGKAEPGFEDFADQFFRLVDLDLFPVHNRDKNRVQIYSVSLARQKEYRVVFVAGLLEKNFPVQVREHALFSDWERQLFNQNHATGLREFKPRQNMERYLFYLATTRATEKLVLTFPHIDREGKPGLASFYLDEVYLLDPDAVKVEIQHLSQPYPKIDEAVQTRELEAAALGALRETPEPGTAFFLAQKLLADFARRERILAGLEEFEAVLSSEMVKKDDFFHLELTSATRLEEYGKCPYRYFANRVLRLKDPEEEMNTRHRGSILHYVLEHFFIEYSKNPTWYAVPEAVRKFVEPKLEEAFKLFPLTADKPYQKNLLKEEQREMLLRFLDHELERLKTSPLQPAYSEFSFGTGEKDDAPPLEIETAPGEKIRITGKIDRIDMDQEKKSGLVIDYKRTAQFKKDDLDLGVALQLPIYLTALEQFLKVKPVGGELYSLKERKKKGFYHAENAEPLMKLSPQALRYPEKEYRLLLEKSLDFIRLYVKGMKNSEIPVKPRSCESYCPYPSVCRVEKWKLPEILEKILKEDKSREEKVKA